MSCNSCYEYTASTTNGPSCGYTTLNSYNGPSSTMGNTYGLASPLPKVTGCTYIVPAWPYKLSYDTLTKGGSCNGYANIQQAYGVGADQCCPKYVASAVPDIPCVPCNNAAPLPCDCNPDSSNPQYIPPRPTC